VEDSVEAREIKGVFGEVEAQDLEPASVLLLQLRVVVVREAVDPDDLMSTCDESISEVRADEAQPPLSRGIASRKRRSSQL
jgi:hypothetical protein